ncbi:MAG: 50S ribosomal protein L10 [Deltaproteobacteria bacterium]|nr:50S ribosomal protein L10 [Deltaproteobacteria bacterium]
MDRRTKEQVAAELHEKLKDFKLAVLTGYSGMDVAKMMALRVVLRKTNTELRVVKNSLLSIASRETDFCALAEHFRGPLAVAIARGDVVETTKALVDFAKKNANLEIKAAVMSGKPLSREQIVILAELPSREILIGKLLSLMVGVQTSLVNVLSGVPRNLVQVLDAYREKKASAN